MEGDSGSGPAAASAHDARLRSLRERGAAMFRQGRIAEAEDAYATVLRKRPADLEAIQLLGCCAANRGQHGRAIEFFDRFLALAPPDATVLCQRAAALVVVGRFEQAIADLDRAIALVPGHAMAYELRGRARAAAGRVVAARADFHRVSELTPVGASVYLDRAKALLALACDQQAVEACDDAIRLQPGSAAAHAARSAALFHLAQFADALASGQQAVALDPGNVDGQFAAGAALLGVGRPEDALRCFDTVLARHPGSALVHDARCGALLDLLRPEAALECAERSIAIEPAYAESHSNRGLALVELGRMAEALASFDRAIALGPQFAPARRNKALCCLLLGRLEEGWPLYESRERIGLPDVGELTAAPRWSGRQELGGRTIFVHAEQGLGDTIQFCRYARLLEARGASVALGVPSQLVRLIRTLSPSVVVLPHTEAPGRSDFQIPVLSLPLAFQTTLATIPAAVPYLHAEEPLVDRWRARLGTHGFRVGISWQGRPSRGDRGRSFPLRLLRGLADIPDVRLISLQKNDGTEQLEDLPAGLLVERLGDDYDAGPDAFVDAAAVMQNLDLVISSDTALLHLAGALGRPTWALLRHIPDWRWLLERGDSPWYPTMRLFRQPQRGDWESVAAAVASALAEAARR